MKLQANDSGAWKNILSLLPQQVDQVKEAATNLFATAGSGSTKALRIPDDNKVVARAEAPHYRWQDLQ